MTERRLAAIVAADVAGYSRLMHEDEDGTYARLSRLISGAAKPAIQEHGGKLVKGTGDGFLAEFPSSVGAGSCALRFLRQAAELMAPEPANSRLVFRVGIHLGEIIAEPSDIFGDGVNIAARLCALAEPGQIVVSGAAYDNLIGRIECSFEDHGDVALKNIARPIHVYRMAAGTAAPPTDARGSASVVVLPFQNLGADPEQDILASAMVEDITTALSYFNPLIVIERSSAATFRGGDADLRQVGRELNVRYALRGSVRRIGRRLRITSQLVQTDTLAQVWADQHNCDYDDIFDAQDRITSAVAAAIEPAIWQAERKRTARRLPASLDAWECYHRGVWHHSLSDGTNNRSAQEFFQRAIDLDATFSSAYQGMVYSFMDDAVLYLTRRMHDALMLAEPLAQKAVLLSPGDAGALVALAYVHFARGNLETSLASAEQALKLNRNSAAAYWSMSGNLVYLGRYDEAAEAAAACLRLGPRDLRNWRVYNHLAIARYLSGHYEAAVAAAEQALRLNPNQPLSSRWLAAALGQLGRLEQARDVINRASSALAPVTFTTYALTRGSWLQRDAHEQLLNGLRKAGWTLEDLPGTVNLRE